MQSDGGDARPRPSYRSDTRSREPSSGAVGQLVQSATATGNFSDCSVASVGQTQDAESPLPSSLADSRLVLEQQIYRGGSPGVARNGLCWKNRAQGQVGRDSVNPSRVFVNIRLSILRLSIFLVQKVADFDTGSVVALPL